MESTAEEVKQNRDNMLARFNREDQEAVASGKVCPDCHSPNKKYRWFFKPTPGLGSFVQCTNYKFHVKPRERKTQMVRHDWYTVLILLMFANAALFDGQRGWGMGLTGVALLIVVLVDGFGVEL